MSPKHKLFLTILTPGIALLPIAAYLHHSFPLHHQLLIAVALLFVPGHIVTIVYLFRFAMSADGSKHKLLAAGLICTVLCAAPGIMGLVIYDTNETASAVLGGVTFLMFIGGLTAVMCSDILRRIREHRRKE